MAEHDVFISYGDKSDCRQVAVATLLGEKFL
jgi:hypothetical protein